ncbi:MAG TPA: hypothetical protein VFS62_04405 [Chloroflexota bacterium]|nr:hypothetical protein [Chloroflexota bacterium]
MSPTEDELEPAEIRTAMARVGLDVSPEDVEAARAGVNRWRRQVQQVRKHIAPEVEPAPVFRAPA